MLKLYYNLLIPLNTNYLIARSWYEENYHDQGHDYCLEKRESVRLLNFLQPRERLTLVICSRDWDGTEEPRPGYEEDGTEQENISSNSKEHGDPGVSVHQEFQTCINTISFFFRFFSPVLTSEVSINVKRGRRDFKMFGANF